MVEIRMVDNRIDEVVGKGVTFHMEDMGSHWALIINDPAHKDGWIFNLPRGKVTLYESPECSSLCHPDEPCMVTADGICAAVQEDQEIKIGSQVFATGDIKLGIGEVIPKGTKGKVTEFYKTRAGGREELNGFPVVQFPWNLSRHPVVLS